MSHIAWGVPIDAGMAIVLWIGIVISAQAFQAVPPSHAPAVVMGLLPGVGAWGAMMAKNGLRAAGAGSPAGPAFGPELLPAFRASDTWIGGAFALEQGFIFTALILSAMTVAVIERQFARGAAWCLLGAALAACGLVNSWGWTPGDTVLVLRPAWPWAVGWALMAAWLMGARWLTRPSDVEH
jgi:AGZA family xanthine/uracil permease-like MFS transporter